MIRVSILVIACVGFVSMPCISYAQTAPITGWAWSDTIGWISLNCSDIGVCATSPYGLVQEADGHITGFAWSEHLGWISADAADVTGCPLGLCEPYIASSGYVTGWLRAVSNGGGWDGWVSLRDSGYGVSASADGLVGWAWGGEVVGWVLFAANLPCAQDAGPYCSGNSLKHKDAQCTVTTLVADCGSSGCLPGATQCTVPTPPQTTLVSGKTIEARPAVVQYGKTTRIIWSVSGATTCHVSGNGDSWYAMSGSYITRPINEAAVYVLSCSGAGGSLTGQVQVNNPPKVREL